MFFPVIEFVPDPTSGLKPQDDKPHSVNNRRQTVRIQESLIIFLTCSAVFLYNFMQQSGCGWPYTEGDLFAQFDDCLLSIRRLETPPLPGQKSVCFCPATFLYLSLRIV